MAQHHEGRLGLPFLQWEKEGLRGTPTSPMLWDASGEAHWVLPHGDHRRNPQGSTTGDQRKTDKGAGLIATGAYILEDRIPAGSSPPTRYQPAALPIWGDKLVAPSGHRPRLQSYQSWVPGLNPIRSASHISANSPSRPTAGRSLLSRPSGKHGHRCLAAWKDIIRPTRATNQAGSPAQLLSRASGPP